MAIKKYRKTAQLYNKNGTDTSNGYVFRAYLNSVGEVGESGNHTISEYIDVSAFAQITLSGVGATSASITNTFYNENHEKVSYFYVDVVPKTVNVPSNAKYIRLTVANARKDTLMLNGGSTALDYEAYGIVPIDWFYRRYETATDAVTSLPVTLYTDGQPVSSYTLKGNTTTSGTPSPSNPITISGVGNKTANLFNEADLTYNRWTDSQGNIVTNVTYGAVSKKIPVTGTNYSIKAWGTAPYSMGVCWYDSSDNFLLRSHISDTTRLTSLTAPQNAAKLTYQVSHDTTLTTPLSSDEVNSFKVMLAAESTQEAYKPYGYEISISSGQTALTPMYLTEQLMKIGDYADSLISTGTATYAIKKYELTGQEDIRSVTQITGGYRFLIRNNWGLLNTSTLISSHFLLNASWSEINCIAISSNLTDMYFILPAEMNVTTINEFAQWIADQSTVGTPVTLWYVLATATTEQFTAPSIPTTGGTATIDVDTTVKPSEMDLTYHGWHEHEPQKFVGGGSQ